MRSRRQRSFRRGRGPRSRVLWDRLLGLDAIQQPGVTTALTLGDPRLLPGSLAGFDMNRTLRRCKLEVNWAVDLDVNVIAWGEMVFGVCIIGRNEPVPSPLMLTSNDQEVDWLDLWNVPAYTYSSTTTTSTWLPAPNASSALFRDIRTQRKLDIDQVVVLVMDFNVLTGALIVAQGLLSTQMSLLWTASPT